MQARGYNIQRELIFSSHLNKTVIIGSGNNKQLCSLYLPAKIIGWEWTIEHEQWYLISSISTITYMTSLRWRQTIAQRCATSLTCRGAFLEQAYWKFARVASKDLPFGRGSTRTARWRSPERAESRAARWTVTVAASQAPWTIFQDKSWCSPQLA